MKTSALLGLFLISTYRFQGFIMPMSIKLKKHNNKKKVIHNNWIEGRGDREAEEKIKTFRLVESVEE